MNITTYFHQHRVTFSTPDGGYSLEDLMVLEAAIKHARIKLQEQEQHALNKQTERRAAPS